MRIEKWLLIPGVMLALSSGCGGSDAQPIKSDAAGTATTAPPEGAVAPVQSVDDPSQP
jgi:hypothetical protein